MMATEKDGDIDSLLCRICPDIDVFELFSFIISFFFPNCLLSFLFFFPCRLVAVVMARHTKLSPSASCMTLRLHGH